MWFNTVHKSPSLSLQIFDSFSDGILQKRNKLWTDLLSQVKTIYFLIRYIRINHRTSDDKSHTRSYIEIFRDFRKPLKSPTNQVALIFKLRFQPIYGKKEEKGTILNISRDILPTYIYIYIFIHFEFCAWDKSNESNVTYLSSLIYDSTETKRRMCVL